MVLDLISHVTNRSRTQMIVILAEQVSSSKIGIRKVLWLKLTIMRWDLINRIPVDLIFYLRFKNECPAKTGHMSPFQTGHETYKTHGYNYNYLKEYNGIKYLKWSIFPLIIETKVNITIVPFLYQYFLEIKLNLIQRHSVSLLILNK